ncbi:hypothetical protein [Gallaecimonas mangrovi]|uniref:hypothetical protein n=1 Tax=Gallaecimonas mangrovi TaxID=2291597 RepID=UPI000E1FBC2E|nr:hypothetical protein [Gallaecimonas mangrovi]
MATQSFLKYRWQRIWLPLLVICLALLAWNLISGRDLTLFDVLPAVAAALLLMSIKRADPRRYVRVDGEHLWVGNKRAPLADIDMVMLGKSYFYLPGHYHQGQEIALKFDPAYQQALKEHLQGFKPDITFIRTY